MNVTDPNYREEYERQWKEHFKERTGSGDEFAHESWGAVTFEEHTEGGYETDPKGSVDEELSYWTDDGD